jgi:hypothetical protein
MGSLLTMLLLLPRTRESTKPKEMASSRTELGSMARYGAVLKGVALEALAGALGLLLVVLFVAFFYLCCLPWMGVR